MKSETFEDVFDREFEQLVGLATLILGSQAIAEETVQEAFIQLHKRWFQIEKPGGFLHTAVVNGCKGLLRKRKVASKHLQLVKPTLQIQEPEHYLIDALQKLRPLRRSIIVLKFYGGYNTREIAQLLEIPEGTARSNLQRATKELRRSLKNEL